MPLSSGFAGHREVLHAALALCQQMKVTNNLLTDRWHKARAASQLAARQLRNFLELSPPFPGSKDLEHAISKTLADLEEALA